MTTIAARPDAIPWNVWAELRGGPPPGYRWPAYCYLPHSLLSAALMATGVLRETDADLSCQVAMQGVIAAWRATQGIYRLDPDVGLSLARCPLTGDLPTDALRRMPEWSIYIEAEPSWLSCDGVPPIHGLWATIDWHEDQGDELRVVWDSEEGPILHLLPLDQRTIVQALASQRNVALHYAALGGAVSDGLLQGENRSQRLERLWTSTLSLILYLCSDDPEIRSARSGGPPSTGRREPQRTRAGWRDHPPAAPEVWEVSYRLGQQIRDGRSGAGGSHAGPRPHIRRAHWHTYLLGPRTGNQERRPRWLPPIPIGLDDDPDRPTIRRVIP